jgi:hypothetical protein
MIVRVQSTTPNYDGSDQSAEAELSSTPACLCKLQSPEIQRWGKKGAE